MNAWGRWRSEDVGVVRDGVELLWEQGLTLRFAGQSVHETLPAATHSPQPPTPIPRSAMDSGTSPSPPSTWASRPASTLSSYVAIPCVRPVFHLSPSFIDLRYFEACICPALLSLMMLPSSSQMRKTNSVAAVTASIVIEMSLTILDVYYISCAQ